MSNIQEVLDRVYVNADDVSYINLYYEAIFLIYVKDSEGCLFGENIYDNNNKLYSPLFIPKETIFMHYYKHLSKFRNSY